MHNRRFIRCGAVAILAAVLGLATACTTPGASQNRPKDENKARGEVVMAMQRYMELLRLGPVDAVVGFYTADAELLEPGMNTLRGREAIRGFLAPLYQQTTIEAASSETEAIEVYGNAAYQWGTYFQPVIEKNKDAAPASFTGRLAAVWRREGDKPWRLVRLMVQPSP